MNPKLIEKLSKLFWYLGWLSLVSTIGYFGYTMSREAFPSTQRGIDLFANFFAHQSVLGIFGWIWSQVQMSSSGYEVLGGIPLLALSALSMLLTYMMPALYAVTIYVLYVHFAKLVEFESEVV